MKRNIIITSFILLMFTSCKELPQNSIEHLIQLTQSCQVSYKNYSAYSDKALNEGYDTISKIFKVFAKSDSIKVQYYNTILDDYRKKNSKYNYSPKIKSTYENLESSILFEKLYSTKKLEAILKDIEIENSDTISYVFKSVEKLSSKRLVLLDRALIVMAIGSESTLKPEYAICKKCGNIFSKGTLLSNCEICNQPSKDYLYCFE